MPDVRCQMSDVSHGSAPDRVGISEEILFFHGAARRYIRAGVSGFEPELSVLETDVLTVDTIPLQKP